MQASNRSHGIDQTLFSLDEKIVLYNGNRRSGEDAVNLAELIQRLTSLMDNVPEAFKQTAKACVDYDIDYDGYMEEISITVQWLEPASEAEIAARKAEVERKRLAQEAREFADYERLKAKFG
jgi:hypothetical protein